MQDAGMRRFNLDFRDCHRRGEQAGRIVRLEVNSDKVRGRYSWIPAYSEFQTINLLKSPSDMDAATYIRLTAIWFSLLPKYFAHKRHKAEN
jgi:hypothetical protein